MLKNPYRRLSCAAAFALAAAVGTVQPAGAQEHALILEPGVACAFTLGIDDGGLPPERRTFTDKDGNAIIVFAGKNGGVTYTNLDNLEVEPLSFKGRGTQLRVTNRPDGTQLLEFSGNVGWIAFSTDVPAGPSTTQISGRLVIENSAPGSGEPVSTVLQQEGRQIDVCAALS